MYALTMHASTRRKWVDGYSHSQLLGWLAIMFWEFCATLPLSGEFGVVSREQLQTKGQFSHLQEAVSGLSICCLVPDDASASELRRLLQSLGTWGLLYVRRQANTAVCQGHYQCDVCISRATQNVHTFRTPPQSTDHKRWDVPSTGDAWHSRL